MAGWRVHGPEKDGNKWMERQSKGPRGLKAYCKGGQDPPRAVAPLKNIYNVIPLLPWWQISLVLSWRKQLNETQASGSRHWNYGKWNSSCLSLLSEYFSMHLKALLPSVLCACHAVTYSSPNYFNIANFIKISAVLRVTAYWRFTKLRFGTSAGVNPYKYSVSQPVTVYWICLFCPSLIPQFIISFFIFSLS
jgi:hypothetical protein